MPLSINVGLSRKASKDYQSTGVSINVTAELDQSLLARPDELQQQIGDLYAQAEQALDRQSAPPQAERTSARPARNGGGRPVRNGNGYANGNGRNAQNGNGHNGGAMTDSQRRAINSIATRLDVDARVEAREILGAELDQLSVRQASELIDHLKSLSPAQNDSGR